MEEAVASLVAAQVRDMKVEKSGEEQGFEGPLRAEAEKVIAPRVSKIRENIERKISELRAQQDNSDREAEGICKKIESIKPLQLSILSQLEALKGKMSRPPQGSSATEAELHKAETNLQRVYSFIRDRRIAISNENPSTTLTYQGPSTIRQHRFKLANKKYTLQSGLTLRIVQEEAQAPVLPPISLQDLPASGDIEITANVPAGVSGNLEAIVMSGETKKCSNLVVFQAT
jgi:hypothetical protein